MCFGLYCLYPISLDSLEVVVLDMPDGMPEGCSLFFLSQISIDQDRVCAIWIRTDRFSGSARHIVIKMYKDVIKQDHRCLISPFSSLMP